ncbi:NPC intracellular cholesterol transporter 2-like [Onthophagus taurus]|uniref:NPC intracellular cholesterol transporter 2-like n=1 Tax=Onthophagus taurus TaxID=166361 RepID=UPI000C20BE54|nr:MD-2-related lipid-recognition protein-like [Onthophagus taurus]
MLKFIVLCFCLATLFCSVLSAVVNVSPCDDYENQCIDEVRINPCKEAARNAPCKAKKGSKVEVEVDFTPDFDSNSLLSQPYWDNGIKDIPMLSMETDGCKYTTCPLKQGTKQTYKYELSILDSYPPATYNVKWKLNGDNEKGCCFGLKIRIVR